jgi:hypothetical protein
MVVFLQLHLLPFRFVLLLPRDPVCDLVELVEFRSAVVHQHLDPSGQRYPKLVLFIYNLLQF